MRTNLLVGLVVGTAIAGAVWYATEPASEAVRTGHVSLAPAEATLAHVARTRATETQPYREAEPPAAVDALMEEARSERKFLAQRRRLARRISKLLAEDADLVERGIETQAQLEVAAEAFACAHARKFDAEKVAVPVAGRISMARYASGHYERVSLLGKEADFVGCNGNQAYEVTTPEPEFPEQFVLYSTTALEGQEPHMRVVRINPGESKEFDVVNRKRLSLLDEMKAELRRNLARLDQADEEEAR